MKKQSMQKRTFLRQLAALWLGAAALSVTGLAHAEDKVTLLSNWYAQAEHGGFYQAVAKGIYKKYGMDVTIKMGGPQVNNMQILVAGQADFSMGYDFAVMKGIEQGCRW
jgi:NitT/TauT family transport system substrate-binding protein